MSAILQIVTIFAAGTLCQITGWWLSIPSIVLLLIAGVVLGPVTHLITPDQLFGNALFPLVEMAVALVLFEGGLSLKKAELGKIGSTVLRLISISAAVSWLGLSMGAWVLFGIAPRTALVLGAILIVSGPTVVIPLLRISHAKSPVEPILRWEGILIDPVGVVFATLLAEAVQKSFSIGAPVHIIMGIIWGFIVGVSTAWAGARLLKKVIGDHLIPDHFVVPVTIACLFSLCAVSNLLHEQSGLITSTVMGLLLARENRSWVDTIEGFIAQLQQLIIGLLFIVLASRLDGQILTYFGWNFLAFLALAVLLIRPIAVLAGTIGLRYRWNERFALAAMAPRGIVSAVLASSLSLPLVRAGLPNAQEIVPITFLMIIGTVVVYGLLSIPVFQRLGVRQENREGILFVGYSPFAIAIAKVLEQVSIRTLFVDSNLFNIQRLRKAGVEAVHGNILNESLHEEIQLDGIGKLVALTSNGEANSLAAVEFKHQMGRSNVFQVALTEDEHRKGATHLSGRPFGPADLTLEKIENLWRDGYQITLCKRGEAVPDNSHVLAEIEGSKLHLCSSDGLQRAINPDLVITLQKS